MAIIESLPFEIFLGEQQNHSEHPLPHFDVRTPAGLQIESADEGVVVTDLKWASFSHFAAAGTLDPGLFKHAPARFQFPKPNYPKDLSISLGNLSRKTARVRGSLLVASSFTAPPIYLLPLAFHHDPHPFPWKAKIEPRQTITMHARTQLQGTMSDLIVRPEHALAIENGELGLKVTAFSFLHPQLKKNIANPQSVRDLTFDLTGSRFTFRNGDIKAGETLYVEITNKSNADIHDWSATTTMKVA